MSSINPNRAGLLHIASVQWGLNQPIPSRPRVDICEKMHYYNLEKQNLSSAASNERYIPIKNLCVQNKQMPHPVAISGSTRSTNDNFI